MCGRIGAGGCRQGGSGVAEGVDFRAVTVLYRQGEASGFLGRLSAWAGTDRGPLTRWGGNKRSFVPPTTIATVRTCVKFETHTQWRRNSTKLWKSCRPFPRRVPSSPHRTINSTCAPHFFFHRLISQPAVLQLLQARCVMQGAIARVHFRNLTYI